MLYQKNKFCVGDTIEIMKPDGSDIQTKVLGIYDSCGNLQQSAPHSKQELHIKLDGAAQDGDIIRALIN